MDRRQQLIPVEHDRRQRDRRENDAIRILVCEIAENDVKINQLARKGQETLDKARQFQEQLKRTLAMEL